MSRAKKAVASEGKSPVPQEETATVSNEALTKPMTMMENLTKSFNERFDEQNKRSNDRIDGLQKDIQQIRSAQQAGVKEEKSGERDALPTEAGGKEITPPKQQI